MYRNCKNIPGVDQPHSPCLSVTQTFTVEIYGNTDLLKMMMVSFCFFFPIKSRCNVVKEITRYLLNLLKKLYKSVRSTSIVSTCIARS